MSGLMGFSCGFRANELSGTTAKQLVFLRASSVAARAGAARAAAAGTVFNIVRRATGSSAVRGGEHGDEAIHVVTLPPCLESSA